MNIRCLLNGSITQQELLNYYNASITYVSLDDTINGFVWMYKDINNIYINKNLSYYMRKKTILHELAHIELNHLGQKDKDLFALNIKKYEDEAELYLKELKENL